MIKIGKIIHVVTSFLYDDLEESINMKIPEGFREYKGKVLKEIVQL